MSLLAKAFTPRRAALDPLDPRRFPDIESYGEALVESGLHGDEIVHLLALAAARLERQRQDDYERTAEASRRETATELAADGRLAAVDHVFARLGWASSDPLSLTASPTASRGHLGAVTPTDIEEVNL